jgi:acetoin utilization deacetylase AcuC-like enzyme
MHVIYPTGTQLHSPPYEIFNGEQTPHNEVPDRFETIRESLEHAQFDLHENHVRVPVGLLKKIHSSDYIQFLKESAGSEPHKYIYPSVFPYRTGQFSQNHLAQLGYYSFDLYTPISSTTYRAALNSASAAYEAAQLIQRGEQKNVYVLCRPPGHHAEPTQMGGYCYLNNCAVAAQYLSSFGRVATLDVDFHHGNGTQHIFYARNDVFTASLHAHPDWKFPFYSGYEDEIGTGEGEGFNANRTLLEGTDNATYQKALADILQRISDFGPDYLVVSFGADIHASDPIGGFKLTTSYLRKIGRTIAELNFPTVIVQEGGYNTELLGENVCSFLEGFRH